MLLILGSHPTHQPPSHSAGQPLSLALRNVCVFLILFQHRTEVASKAEPDSSMHSSTHASVHHKERDGTEKL